MTPVTLLTLTVGTATYRYADIQTDAYPACAPRLAGPADLEEAAASPLTRSLPVRRARVRLSNVAVAEYVTTAPSVSQVLGTGQDVVGAQASVQVVDADTRAVLTTIGGYVEEIPALSLSEATLVVSDALAGDASTLLPHCALTDLFPSVQAPDGTALAVICGTARRVRLYPVSHDDVVQVAWDVQATPDGQRRRLRRRYRDAGHAPRVRAGDQFAYEVWRSTPDADAYFSLRLGVGRALTDLDDMIDQNGLRNDSFAGTPMGCEGWYRRVFKITRGIGGGTVFYTLKFQDQGGAAQAGTARFARAALLDSSGNVRHRYIGESWATNGIPPYSELDISPPSSTFTVESDFGWTFGAWRAATGVAVAHAYRNGRRMDPSEYTVVTPLPGVGAIKITSTRPPDEGEVIHADFTSTEFAANPANVTRFFLSDAHHGLGRTVDAAQFTTAAAAYTARKLTVGGAATKQTPAATLLQEFLLHGAVLTHDASGTIGMQVDGPGTRAALELGHADDTGWHNFTPANAAPVRAAQQPKSLLVRGVPDPGFAGEPERWLATTKRSRTFPRGAEQEVAYRYIVDHASLDRQAHYLWEQMQAQTTPLTGDLNVREPDAYDLDVGDRLTVTIPGLGIVREDYRIGAFQSRGARFGLTLHPYRAAAFVYAAGTDQDIEPQARQLVDYRRTQPQAPTALAVSADALRTLTNGKHEVSVTASVTAPVAPVDQIYFKLVKTGGVATRAEATVPCTPRQTGVSATLVAESGEGYTVHAFADMSTNDAGFRRGDAVTATATAVIDPDATLTPGRPGFNASVPLLLYTGGVGTLDLVGEWHAAGVADSATAWPLSLSLTLVTATEETRDQLLALRSGQNVALYDDATHWASGTLTATPTSVTFTASGQTRFRVTVAFLRQSQAGTPAFSTTNRRAQLDYTVPAPHPAAQAEIWIRTPWSETAPAPPKPTSDATFTRQSGAVTGLSGGWTADVPATGGSFLWRVRAPIPEGWGNTHTIAPGDWQIPRRISHDGLSYFEAAIYKVQGVNVAAPARPTGGSYDFATRTLTPPAGWSPPPGPALGADQRLYVSAATAHDGAGDLWRPIVGEPNLVSQSVATAAGSWVSSELTGDPAVTLATAPSTVGPEPPSGKMFVAKGGRAEDRVTARNPDFGGNRLDIVAYVRGSGDPSGSQLAVGASFAYADNRPATAAHLTDALATTDNRWTKVTGSLPIPSGADRIRAWIAFTGTGVADSATINFADVSYQVVDVEAWTAPRRAAQAAAVNMVYKRSTNQPAVLNPGPDRIPTGTSDAAGTAPGSGRLWENFGIRPPEAANWTWGGWRKAEGEDGTDGRTVTGPPGTTPTVVAYAYAVATSGTLAAALAPSNAWATNRTGLRGTRTSAGVTVRWYAERQVPNRTYQYLLAYSRRETGSAKTNWENLGVVETWKPGVPVSREVVTGMTVWSTAAAHTANLFPNRTPAIGDTLTQLQYAKTDARWKTSNPFRSIRVWSGESWDADHEIVGGLLVAGRLASRTNIIAGGAIKSADYASGSKGFFLGSDFSEFQAANIRGTLSAGNIESNVINARFFWSSSLTLSNNAAVHTITKVSRGVDMPNEATGLLIYYENSTGMNVTAVRFGSWDSFQRANNCYATCTFPGTNHRFQTVQFWRGTTRSSVKVKRARSENSITLRVIYWVTI